MKMNTAEENKTEIRQKGRKTTKEGSTLRK